MHESGLSIARQIRRIRNQTLRAIPFSLIGKESVRRIDHRAAQDEMPALPCEIRSERRLRLAQRMGVAPVVAIFDVELNAAEMFVDDHVDDAGNRILIPMQLMHRR